MNGFLRKTRKLSESRLKQNKNNIRYHRLDTTYATDKYKTYEAKEGNLPLSDLPFNYSTNDKIYIHSTIWGLQREVKQLTLDKLEQEIDEKINFAYTKNNNRIKQIKEVSDNIKQQVFGLKSNQDISISPIFTNLGDSNQLLLNVKSELNMQNANFKQFFNEKRGTNTKINYVSWMSDVISKINTMINEYKNGTATETEVPWNDRIDGQLKDLNAIKNKIDSLPIQSKIPYKDIKQFKTIGDYLIGNFAEYGITSIISERLSNTILANKEEMVKTIVYSATTKNKNITMSKPIFNGNDLQIKDNRLKDATFVFQSKILPQQLNMNVSYKARKNNDMSIKTQTFNLLKWLQQEDNSIFIKKLQYLVLNYNALYKYNSNSFNTIKRGKNLFTHNDLLYRNSAFSLMRKCDKLVALFLLNFGFVANSLDLKDSNSNQDLEMVVYADNFDIIDKKAVTPAFIITPTKPYETWKIFKRYNEDIMSDTIQVQLFESWDKQVKSKFTGDSLKKLYEFKRKRENFKRNVNSVYGESENSLISVKEVLSSSAYAALNVADKMTISKLNIISMNIHLEEGE